MMIKRFQQPSGLDRRTFLRGATLGGAALIGGPVVALAQAQQDPLDLLLNEIQGGDFGQGFDAAARKPVGKGTLPTLSAQTVEATEQAIPHYEAIVGRGGWPTVAPAKNVRLGARNPSVVALRQRLAASGDLAVTSGISEVYDSYVDAAVRRFQARHGIGVDGALNQQTINALNVPAPARLNQLKTNLVRLRSMSGHGAPRSVVCNIPAAQIEAIENGVVVSRHTAVVGKPDRPSPDLQSRIVEINFNPYWTVPVSIVRKDLIPKMQAEPDYLTKNRIRILDGRGEELAPAKINWYSEEAVNYKFKQDPGDLNSLGSIRINFPSTHGVYMHDTPYKNLFGDDFRFHSSGCMRVQNVRDLVNWVLADQPGWSRPEIEHVIKSGERKDARIAKPVPLYWIYVSAWADHDGVVQFRDDIYARDGLGQVAAAPVRG
jgi:murein L,D-transpeptidase YcbB/YkuD